MPNNNNAPEFIGREALTHVAEQVGKQIVMGPAYEDPELLDRLGIAVRTGHHCAQPVMQRYGIQGAVRASFAMYNTKDEVDALVEGVRRVSRMF